MVGPGGGASLYEASPSFIVGDTTLYGTVERVGGVVPNVSLRVTDTQVVHFVAPQAMAKELARHLYVLVGVEGRARWSARDLTIERFKASRVIPSGSRQWSPRRRPKLTHYPRVS